MNKVKFDIVAEGYSVNQVDRYIELLQEEYGKLLIWCEELEGKTENGGGADSGELEELKQQNEKLKKDCRTLAKKLSEKINDTPAETVFEETRSNDKQYDELLERANIDAAEILEQSRKEADIIIASAEKTREKIISDAANEIIAARKQTEELDRESKKLAADIEKLKKTRYELLIKLSKAKQLLQ